MTTTQRRQRACSGFVSLVLLGYLLAGCAALAREAPKITEEPTAIFAQLSTVPSVEDAAEQLMTLLDIRERDIQVRLVDTTACALCEMQTAENNPPTFVTVAEAAKVVEPGYAIWLHVGNFNCAYFFSDDELIPQQCDNSEP